VSYPETLTQKLRWATDTPGEVRREGEGRRGVGTDGRGEGGWEDEHSWVEYTTPGFTTMSLIPVL